MKRILAIITAVFYLAGFVCAAHAALTARTAQGAIAWTVSLVSVPFVAVPAYLVFGRNKFEGMVEAYEARQDEIDEVGAEIRQTLEPWHKSMPNRPDVHKALKALSGFDMVGANSVELLINGEATFSSILEGVAAAEDYILFQFYMIHDDEIGREVKEALLERARWRPRIRALRRNWQPGPAAHLREVIERCGH